MEKRVALYYPHSRIRDELALKRAMLLWDEIETIVPRTVGGSLSWRSSREISEAMEIVAKERRPTEAEQLKAHNIIDSLTADGFLRLSSQAELHDEDDRYVLSNQKLMFQTWKLLSDRRLLIGSEHLRRYERETKDYIVRENVGLVVMAVLAHVLAGKSRALYTDRWSSYDALWSTLCQSEALSELDSQTGATELLVPIAFSCVNLEDVALTDVIALRKRELDSGGESLRALRHKLLSFTDQKAIELTKLMSKSDFSKVDRAEFLRQVESDIKDDVISLRRELRASAIENMFSKDLLTPLVFGVAAASSLFSDIPKEITGTAAVFALGSVSVLRSKYLGKRLEIQQKHPSAYTLCVRRNWI